MRLPCRGCPKCAGREMRESIWGVARGWMPWYLAMVGIAFVAWMALVVYVELGNPHTGVAHAIFAIVHSAAPGIPVIAFSGIIVVAGLDSLGGLVLVTAKILTEKFLEPMREKIRAEGKAHERERWVAWNERRLDAERLGRPFDEGPPA